MLRRHAVAAGLALGGMGQLYYAAGILSRGNPAVVPTAIMGLGMVQLAAGLALRHPWTMGVGASMGALASYNEFQGILFESYSVYSVGSLLEGLGFVLVGAAVGLWLLARSDRNPDPDRVDEAGAVLALRVGCGLAAAGSAIYFAANVHFWYPVYLPGNVLVVAGLGLAAVAARAPLLGEEAPEAAGRAAERPS